MNKNNIEEKLNILDPITFSKIIMDLKRKDKDSTYIEIIEKYCEEKGIELEKVPSLLIPKLFYAIEEESEDLHLVKRSGIIKLC